MPTLIKKTSIVPSASTAVMGAAILKQQGKSLAGSMSLFGGTLAKRQGKSLAASMLPFSAPAISGDNVYWNGAYAFVSGFSQAFTVKPAPYPCIVVDVMMDSALALTNCTYGGVTVPMVQVGTLTTGATITILWQGVLPNCPTGTNALVITFGSSDIATFGIRSYNGVDPLYPVNTKGISAQNSNPSLSLTTTAPGCWIVDAIVASGGPSNIAGPTAPQEQDALQVGSRAGGISHNGPLAVGTTSDGWSTIGGSAAGLIGAIALKPASQYVLLKQTGKSIAASTSTFAGAINRSASQAFSAAMSLFSGSETKSTFKTIAASMNSFSGTMNRSIGSLIAAGMSSFSATITKQTNIGIAASMALFAGTMNTLRVFLMSFNASMSAFSGTVTKQIGKSIPASMQQFTATLFKRTILAIAASMQTWTVAFRNGSQIFFVSIDGSMAVMGAAVTKALDRAITASMANFDATIDYARPTFCPPNYFVDAQGLVYAVAGGDILSTPLDAQETSFSIADQGNTFSAPSQNLTFGVRYKKKGPCCP